MRSKWIEHKGKKIFYVDFSNLLFDTDAFERESNEALAIIVQQPKSSVRLLVNIQNLHVNKRVVSAADEAAKVFKDYIYKQAVLGATVFARTMAVAMVAIASGPAIKFFNQEEDALEWLVKD